MLRNTARQDGRRVSPGGALLARCALAAGLITGMTVATHVLSVGAEGRPPVAPALGPLGAHVVRQGETMRGIALRYGMRMDDLARLNATTPGAVLLPGRRLWVPLERAVNARAGEPAVDGSADAARGPTSGATVAVATPAPESDATPPPPLGEATAAGRTYTVAPGDTLYAISRWSGVSVEDLKRWNGLPADGSLRAGDVLVLAGAVGATEAGTVPAPGGATRDAYTVVAGDTLASIAGRFGTTVGALQHDNGLSGDTIRAGDTLVVPRAGGGPVAPGGPRRIEIDVGDQRMYVWQGDALVWSWVVSTGMAGYPTRRGTFAVQSKIPNAWSSPWQLWMPHWLGIYWAGGSENGIHALPIINGQRLWAGALGTPISYGCVVLGVQEAELLYNWAEIGTPVIVHD